MKKTQKISVVAAAFLLVASLSGFADDPKVTIHGWGRGGFVPFVYEAQESDLDADQQDTLYAFEGATWNGYFPRVRLQVEGGTDQAGAALWIQTDTGSLGFGDQAYLWAKPWNWLKLQYGKYKVDDLRGKIGDWSDLHGYLGGMNSGDAIFMRFESNAMDGAYIGLTPVQNLLIGINLPNLTGVLGVYKTAGEVYGNADVAVGYTLENVGLIRVGYFGSRQKTGDSGSYPEYDGDVIKTYNDGNSYINAAFALTSIQNLTLDLGLKYYLATKGYIPGIAGFDPVTNYGDSDYTYSEGLKVSVGANYAAGDFGILGRIDTAFLGKADFKVEDADGSATKGFGLDVYLTPSYNLGTFIIGADLHIAMIPDVKGEVGSTTVYEADSYIKFGAALWAQKPLAGGSIKAALAFNAPYTDGDKVDHGLVIGLPIVLEYSF